MKASRASTLLTPIAFAVGAVAATSGDLNILCMNVAGLPAILNDNSVPGDKATNAGSIGTLLSRYGYDIINLQEVGLQHLMPSKTSSPKLINLFHKYRTSTTMHTSMRLIHTPTGLRPRVVCLSAPASTH
jgi:hypothetical protein